MDSGKYLLDAVIMQEFALLGERLDLGGICKFKAVGLFDLKMDVRFLYIHHKFINVHKIIVTLFRIVSPVRKDIAARDRIINIEACLFEDLTTDCLFGCLPSADTTARYLKCTRCPFFCRNTLCDQEFPVQTSDDAKHRQVIVTIRHRPVIPFHRASGKLFILVVNIPEFHKTLLFNNRRYLDLAEHSSWQVLYCDAASGWL